MSNSLAVIGLPHVREALASFGFEVVSGDGFPEVSRRIREAAATSALPVLVEDHKQIGLEQLISRLPESAPVVIVRGAEPILGETRSSIPVASSLGDYLGALGFQDLDPMLQGVRVEADGTIPQPLPETLPAREHRVDSTTTEPDSSDRAPAEPVEDWLDDEGDDAAHPAPSLAEPAPVTERAAAQSALTDWIEDSNDDSEPAAALSGGSEAEDEEFDGFHSPTPHRVSRSHRVEPAPESSPTFPGRRRITLPTFDTGTDSAPITDADPQLDPLDDALFDDLTDSLEGPGVEDEVDADTALDDVTKASTTIRSRRSTAPAEVIACFSGKGGEGKSTLALAFAQAAAEIGGKSVCLIDANRAQGDLGLYLRVRTTDLPSIFDAVMIGDPASAILSPEQLNQARQGRGDHLAFSFVQAPRPVKGSEDISAEIATVTAEHYTEVLQIARARFDLVIIDTQITEGLDTTGVIDRVVAPLLARGGYGVGICELTTPGVENLLVAMESLRQHGAEATRMMSIANKVRPSITDYGKLPQLLGRDSSWKGAIHYDDRIYDDLVARRIPYAVPTLYGVVMDVLLSVTGDPEFDLRDSRNVPFGRPWWKRWLRR
ncbi:nucleotide-binding protein [Brachybacterium tyrofermentans]|uniref:nucleotide-binding protein n=1 Tax=Brachybacterium tyrofermentans TaxID=47848 RepID=UPI003FD4DC2C